MRSFVVGCCGMFALVVTPLDHLHAQTDLFVFPQNRGVMVRPPVATVYAPPAVVPNMALPTTTYRVPTPAPVIAPPVASSVVYEDANAFQGGTTVFYGPTESATAIETNYQPQVPAEVASEWTPVEPAVTAYSPIVTTNEPTVTEYAPTTTYRVPDSPPSQVVYSSDWAATAPAAVVSDPVTVTYPPTVTYSAYAAAAATAQVNSTPATVPVYAGTAIPVGPQVTVRPKVYVQGQPIRNMFRAITP